MKKAIFCVIALGISVATVYGQDEVTAINTGAANFLMARPLQRIKTAGEVLLTRMLRGCAIISQVIRCIHWEVFIR